MCLKKTLRFANRDAPMGSIRSMSYKWTIPPIYHCWVKIQLQTIDGFVCRPGKKIHPPVWGWWSKWVIVPPLIRMPCNQGSLDFVLVMVTLLGMKIYKIGGLQTCSHFVWETSHGWDENDRDLNNWNIYDDMWIMYIYIIVYSVYIVLYMM